MRRTRKTKNVTIKQVRRCSHLFFKSSNGIISEKENTMKRKYFAVAYKDSDGFCGYIPDFDYVTEGDDFENLKYMVEDLAKMVIEDCIEHNREIKTPSSIDDIYKWINQHQEEHGQYAFIFEIEVDIPQVIGI